MKLKEMYGILRKDRQIIADREDELIKKILEADFPVPGSFYVNAFGKYNIEIVVIPENSKDVRTLMKRFSKLFNINWTHWDIGIFEHSGKCYYIGNDNNYFGKNENLSIRIDNLSLPKSCKIVKKEKKVVYYEKVCEGKE